MLLAAVDRPHREHGWLDRLDLPADDRLEVEDREGRQDDRVDGQVGHGAVAPLASDRHVDRSRAGEHRPRSIVHLADRAVGLAVQRQGEVGLGKPLIEAVVEHLPGPADGLLGGLGDQDDGPGPCVLVLGEPGRRGDQAGHVDVVAAGVHHADLAAQRVGRLGLARVRQAGAFGHGQGVHVGSNHDDRPRPVLDHPHDPQFADARRDLGARLPQFLGDPSGGLDLLKREFRVRVQVSVEILELLLMVVEPGRDGRGGLSHTRARPRPRRDDDDEEDTEQPSHMGRSPKRGSGRCRWVRPAGGVTRRPSASARL